MTELFAVPRIEAFDAWVPPDTKVAFHGVNKSGSLSMATTIRDAYAATGRSGEFFGHYFMSGMPLADYLRAVDALQGHRFLVAHYLYGSLPPRPGRVLVTQFRHPLPRLLSCYNWLKRKHEARKEPTAFPSIEQWATETRGRRYSQVMQFGVGFAPDFQDRMERMTARDLYENALDAIERDVFCFGIAERFEESIVLFAALCRLPTWCRGSVTNATRAGCIPATSPRTRGRSWRTCSGTTSNSMTAWWPCSTGASRASTWARTSRATSAPANPSTTTASCPRAPRYSDQPADCDLAIASSFP